MDRARSSGEVRTTKAKLTSLSPAERSVLRLIARNRSTLQISEELNIRPKTVENHRSSICRKLGVTGNNALTRYALDHPEELKSI
jgi:DNA-binding CsgD family transcriptional regulator